MDWKRFKKIIIVVLIIINIVFLVYFLNVKMSDSRIEKETKNNVISVLKKNNIILEEEVFPKNREKCSACYVTRLIETDSDFANRLKGESGEITENDELFIITPPKTDKIKMNESDVRKACYDYMNSYGINSEMYKETSVKIDGKTAKARYNLFYEECEFFDSFLDFELTEKGIKRVSGRNIIKNDSVSVYEETLMPIESILVAISENKEVEKPLKISGIEFGYYFGKSAGVYVNVLSLPVWEVSFEDGTELYFDARNGNLIKVS